MIRSLLLSVVICVFIFFITCLNPTQNDSTIPHSQTATILSPTDNQDYDPYNSIYLIFEYDTTHWYPTFDWECSIDSGTTWERVNVIPSYETIHHQLQKETAAHGPYKYDTREWKPELNELEENIDIWFKVSAYGGNKHVLKKNIRIRKPR